MENKMTHTCNFIRYIGTHKLSGARTFQSIVDKAIQATFPSRTGLGEKKVRIKISIEEVD